MGKRKMPAGFNTMREFKTTWRSFLSSIYGYTKDLADAAERQCKDGFWLPADDLEEALVRIHRARWRCTVKKWGR